MRNLRFELAYDGSHFYGWQRQDGFHSVQAAVEDAFLALTGDPVTVHGAGRTDTGVHALRQVANAHVASSLDDDRLRHALNAHLPEGVAVNRLETCPEAFHARFDARAKRYVYLVRTSRFRPPFAPRLSHWLPQALDGHAMRRAARVLVGRHDFRAFGNAGSERTTTVRTITALRLVFRRDGLGLVVQGDGFLYKMVRNLAGTLLAVGKGKLTPKGVEQALARGQRKELGPTAPARGLYLARVLYPGPVFPGRDRGPHGVPGAVQL